MSWKCDALGEDKESSVRFVRNFAPDGYAQADRVAFQFVRPLEREGEAAVRPGMRWATIADVKNQPFDVCVVDFGTVGLAVAVPMAQRCFAVLLLEAGGERPTAAALAQVAATVVHSARHARLEIAVARAFGGTGWLWGRRCVPLDQLDFSPRKNIDADGWPISAVDLAPYHEAAAALFGCKPAEFRPLCRPAGSRRLASA